MQEALLIYWNTRAGTTCSCWCSPCPRRPCRPLRHTDTISWCRWWSRSVQRAHQLCLFTAADLPLPTFALPFTILFLTFFSILILLPFSLLFPVSFLLCGRKTWLFYLFSSPNGGLFCCAKCIFFLFFLSPTLSSAQLSLSFSYYHYN